MRLRRKSCLAPAVRCGGGREKVSSGTQAARASAGDCGDEDQVGRAGSILVRRSRGALRASDRADDRPSSSELKELHMDVVVTGRHCEVSDRFRSHVTDKLARLEKHDHRIIRVQVEVEKEANPRQSRPRRPRGAHRLLQGPGDPGRGRRRRQDGRARPRRRQDGRPDAPGRRPPARPPRPRHQGRDRRRARRARRADGPPTRPSPTPTTEVAERQVGPITVTGEGPLVVREKTHPAARMTLDQALYEMELVGHDFYLFVDKESEQPVGRLPPPRLRLRRDLARHGLRLARPGAPLTRTGQSSWSGRASPRGETPPERASRVP